MSEPVAEREYVDLVKQIWRLQDYAKAFDAGAKSGVDLADRYHLRKDFVDAALRLPNTKWKSRKRQQETTK